MAMMASLQRSQSQLARCVAMLLPSDANEALTTCLLSGAQYGDKHVRLSTVSRVPSVTHSISVGAVRHARHARAEHAGRDQQVFLATPHRQRCRSRLLAGSFRSRTSRSSPATSSRLLSGSLTSRCVRLFTA